MAVSSHLIFLKFRWEGGLRQPAEKQITAPIFRGKIGAVASPEALMWFDSS